MGIPAIGRPPPSLWLRPRVLASSQCSFPLRTLLANHPTERWPTHTEDREIVLLLAQCTQIIHTQRWWHFALGSTTTSTQTDRRVFHWPWNNEIDLAMSYSRCHFSVDLEQMKTSGEKVLWMNAFLTFLNVRLFLSFSLYNSYPQRYLQYIFLQSITSKW